MENKKAHEQPFISICDTNLFPIREGFAALRETIQKAFMPWLLEYGSSEPFSARIESFATDVGSFGRTLMSPLTGIRTVNEIAKSPDECLYANYVLAGELHVEQGDVVTSAKPGDLIVYDSARPVRHVKLGETFEDLSFSIHKSQICAEGQRLDNLLVPAEKIMAPLAGCLSYLKEHIATAPPDELTAVTAACASFLPLVSGWKEKTAWQDAPNDRNRRMDRELLMFIEAQLGNPDLNPRSAAEHLQISVRYVHKLFATRGTTFGNFVRTLRLARIRFDLHALSLHHPISSLAYRWGFNDLSTFQRAFKKEFGCTPGQYRAKL